MNYKKKYDELLSEIKNKIKTYEVTLKMDEEGKEWYPDNETYFRFIKDVEIGTDKLVISVLQSILNKFEET